MWARGARRRGGAGRRQLPVRSPSRCSARRSAAGRRWAPASCCWSTCSRHVPGAGGRGRGARRRATETTDGDGTLPDDPLADHPLAEELRAGPHRGFTTAVRRLVLVRGAATAAGATGAWVTGRVTGSRSRAGSMGLAALIGTQLAQTAWTGRRSPLVLLTAAGSFAVLVAVVQTPVVNRFFRCRPLDPFAWAAVLGWSVAGAGGGGTGARAGVAGRSAGRRRPSRHVASPAPRPTCGPAETTTGRAWRGASVLAGGPTRAAGRGVVPPEDHAPVAEPEQAGRRTCAGSSPGSHPQQRRRARDVRAAIEGARQLSVAVSPVYQSRRCRRPVAKRSTHAAVGEHDARRSSRPDSATVSAAVSRAGEDLQASSSSLPAATATVTPSSMSHGSRRRRSRPAGPLRLRFGHGRGALSGGRARPSRCRRSRPRSRRLPSQSEVAPRPERRPGATPVRPAADRARPHACRGPRSPRVPRPVVDRGEAGAAPGRPRSRWPVAIPESIT
jgi:hypothetical protein